MVAPPISSRPDDRMTTTLDAAFLLRHGELLEQCRDLHVLAYENGFLSDPDRQVQRIAAMALPAPGAMSTTPTRHPL